MGGVETLGDVVLRPAVAEIPDVTRRQRGAVVEARRHRVGANACPAWIELLDTLVMTAFGAGAFGFRTPMLPVLVDGGGSVATAWGRAGCGVDVLRS
jgi:hypothetical protein